MHFRRAQNPVRDPEDFERFYLLHARGVLTFLVRRVYDPEVAVDLMAETFASAFSSRHSYRGNSAGLSAWVYSIARNQLSNFHRRGRVERSALERLGLEAPELSDSAIERVLELAESEKSRAQVADALTKLNPGQRETVELRVIEELSYPEVASRLNLTEEAARARVSRGLGRLAALLGEPTTEGEEV